MRSKLYTLIFIVSLLSGCAGVGIPNSSDPNKKLALAFSAMNQGRFVPARKLIREAEEIFKANNDKVGLGHVYSAYGVFHKYTPAVFNKPVIGIEPDMKKSQEYFKKAIKIFDEVGDTNSSAKVHFGLGNAIEDNKNEQCKQYDIALKKYNPNGTKFPINPRFKDFPSMVNAFKDKFCN